MSQGNEASRPLFTLPDELFSFVVGEQPYAIDIIDCHKAQNRIAEEVKDHPDDAFWFLSSFAGWLHASGGPPIGTLRTAQLDALWFKCREEFAERKKSQNASLERALNSRPSTAPSPAEDLGLAGS